MTQKVEELAPEVRELCVKLLQACALAGHPIIIVESYRSNEQQENLYAKGRTRPGSKVTNARAGDSFHNYRLAFDVCFLKTDGRLSWEGPWESVGKLGEDLGLEWGGRWHKLVDKPHFQLPGGKTIAQLKTTHKVTQIV